MTSLLFCACNVNISVNQNKPASDDKKEALQEEEETAKEIRYNDNSSLLRLDDDGYLYYMDYTKDYYSPEVIDALRKLGFVDSGCSSFFTHNTEGEPITCRNYDYPHRVSKEDRTITGLNFVLHCKPEGNMNQFLLLMRSGAMKRTLSCSVAVRKRTVFP